MTPCQHLKWLPMMGGYRYECSEFNRAVGIRHTDGVIRPYSDNGRILRDAQAREAWDTNDRRLAEAAQRRAEREDE